MKTILHFIGAFVFYLFAFVGLALAGASIWRMVAGDGPPIGVEPTGWYVGYGFGAFLTLVAFVFVGRILRFVIAGRWSHDRRADRINVATFKPGGTD